MPGLELQALNGTVYTVGIVVVTFAATGKNVGRTCGTVARFDRKNTIMSFKQYWRGNLVCGGLTLGILGFTPTARANVYASNIKFNGSTNATAAAGLGVTISYILNEPASLGVSLQILSGTNVVRVLNIPGQHVGTLHGFNEVLWDTRDAGSNYVANGTYSVNITAASSGYTNWEQTTTDGADQTWIWEGRGIAVDRNANGLYYGRIFVANADTGNDPANILGDRLGIMKLNADGSAADEGGSSAALDGHTWAGGGESPWKLAVSDDDFVYVDDLQNNGEVFRWDPTFSTNSLLYALRRDNRPASAHLDGPALVGAGTNAQMWMGDRSGPNGVLKWPLDPNGACPSNNLGTTVVGLGGDLKMAPSALALDKFGNIYVCQSVTVSGDTNSRVLRFPAYDPSTNGGSPELTADWAIGGGDDEYGGATALAVDPTGTYLAVCFLGASIGGVTANGNTKILSTANGALVTNVDLGVAMLYPDGNYYTNHIDTACAWDAVGNLYYIDSYFNRWRAVSPPGTNQSTTLGAARLQIQLPPIQITSIQPSGSTVTITFTAGAVESTNSFVVQSASSPVGPYAPIGGVTFTVVSPGVFQAVFQAGSQPAFYRIARVTSSPQPPHITSLRIAGGTATIDFTAGASDPSGAFALVSAAGPLGPYLVAAGASIQPLSAGVFRATVLAGASSQFYRIRR
jgi:hypothetical protein